MYPVSALLPRARAATAEEFARSFPHPALVVADAERGGGQGVSEATRRVQPVDPEAWLTQAHEDLDPREALGDAGETMSWKVGAPESAPVAAPAPEQQVAFVTKGEGNPFPQMVTLGRVPNNDLVFLHPTVSKVHAYFRRDEEGRWWLHDSRATNGTWVERLRLEPGGAALLADGAAILLGPALSLRFFLPESLHGYLCALGLPGPR